MSPLVRSCQVRSFSSASIARNHYRTLGLHGRCSQQEIRKSYLNKMLLLHPDRQGQQTKEQSHSTKEQFMRVATAYKVLSNSRLRKQYDLDTVHGTKDTSSHMSSGSHHEKTRSSSSNYSTNNYHSHYEAYTHHRQRSNAWEDDSYASHYYTESSHAGRDKGTPRFMPHATMGVLVFIAGCTGGLLIVKLKKWMLRRYGEEARLDWLDAAYEQSHADEWLRTDMDDPLHPSSPSDHSDPYNPLHSSVRGLESSVPLATRIPPPVVRPPPPPTLDLLQTSKADLTTAACDVLTAWSAVGKAVVHASTSSDMAHKTIKSFVAVDDALERTSANMQRSLAEMTLLLRGTVETHKLLQVSICD
ncbi:hypothetical protein BSLG_005172 [Batrachochytrium salamandrivorans]|nr:hypothetical protein BSLG_005172 [Batrachochytrium salamandrivorans]